MRETSDAGFETDVLRAEGPTIVDFWAPWCKPCDAIEPILEELAATHDVRLVRLDIDRYMSVPSRYGVLSLPTVMVFRDGQPCVAVVGARSRAHYERELAPHL